MSWRVTVRVRDGGSARHGNMLRFATQEEAAAYAADLLGRWTLVEETFIEESQDPVNDTWPRTVPP